MKPTLFELCCILILVLLAACTVIIGNDNSPSQVDDNDNEILTGLGE